MPTTGVCFAREPEICGGIPGVVDGMSKLHDPEAIGLTDVIELPDVEAVRAARELCARGFPVGHSSGLNYAAAKRLALLLGPKHNRGLRAPRRDEDGAGGTRACERQRDDAHASEGREKPP